jgi:hypothetical protein
LIGLCKLRFSEIESRSVTRRNENRRDRFRFHRLGFSVPPKLHRQEKDVLNALLADAQGLAESPVTAAPASTSLPRTRSCRKSRQVEVSRSPAAAEETRRLASADPPHGLAAAAQGAAAVPGETAAPAATRSRRRDSRGPRPPPRSRLARWSDGSQPQTQDPGEDRVQHLNEFFF